MIVARWRRGLLHSSLNWRSRTLSAAASFRQSNFQLQPEAVESTVSNCPSDAIALSFFLWCARQPNYFHSSGSFDRLLPAVRRLMERLGSVRGVVSELEALGCPVKAQTFMILLRLCSRGSLYVLALEAFDEMRDRGYVPNAFANNMVLDLLFKMGMFDRGMSFFRDMEYRNFLTYNIVLCNLCKLNLWLGARHILKEMVNRRLDLNVGSLTMVLDCFRKAGRIRESWQLLAFHIVSGKQPTTAFWTILIDVVCSAGKVDTACILMRKMEESECQPTVVTYTVFVKGLLKAQMYDMVLVLLDMMISKKCNFDLTFFNVLIDGLSKARRYYDAMQAIRCLLDLGLQFDSFTLSSIVCLLSSAENLRLLLPRIISESHIPLDLIAYNTLINSCCKAGLPFQAKRFYREMVGRGFAPDSYSFVGLLNSFRILNRIHDALNAYYDIVANNHNVDAYVHAAILDWLIKEKRCHSAIQLFRRAVQENYCLDVVCYTIVINGLFRSNRSQEACSLFEKMKHSGPIPSFRTYNVMLYGLCKRRDLDAVSKLLRDMEIAGFEMDLISFNVVLHLLIKLHRFNSALFLFDKMYEFGLEPNAVTYSLLRKVSCCTTGEHDQLYAKCTSAVEHQISSSSSECDLQNETLECSAC